MITATIALIAAGCAFFLGLLTGGMARSAKNGDEALRRAFEERLAAEAARADFDSLCGSFDNLGQLAIGGKAVYSLTLYGDGSGDYTLSDHHSDSDLTSYGGTDA